MTEKVNISPGVVTTAPIGNPFPIPLAIVTKFLKQGNAKPIDQFRYIKIQLGIEA